MCTWLQIMELQELEEEGKEDLTKRVAEAPRMHHKLAALTDLDKDQSWVPAGAGADIDLSLLTSCLLPLDQVAEPDEVWQYDVLFAEVKAELSNEEEGADVSKEGECGL
eukprot:jgi/Chrzof1/10331/Cz04g38050.t1